MFKKKNKEGAKRLGMTVEQFQKYENTINEIARKDRQIYNLQKGLNKIKHSWFYDEMDFITFNIGDNVLCVKYENVLNDTAKKILDLKSELKVLKETEL